MSLDEFLVIFFGLLVVMLVEFSTIILVNRLHVLSLAVRRGFQYESEGTGGWMLPIGRLAVQYCTSFAPLFSCGTPTSIRRQGYSTTFMQGTTVRRCSSSVLTGIIQITSASMFPRSEIHVFSKDPNERVIQRTVLLE